MKLSEIKSAIKATTISFRKGVYIARCSYYWGISKSGEIQRDYVLKMFPDAKIQTFGNHFTSFRGGAPCRSPVSLLRCV